MRDLVCAVIWASVWLPSWAVAAHASIPNCAGNVEISSAHIVRVEKNGALILQDGRAVLLEGIKLPLGHDDPEELGNRALAALRDMALAGPVTFTAIAPKEDRFDRIRAQAFGQVWFQTALLEQGLARVSLAPDRGECGAQLYDAENRGRAKREGVWALVTNTSAESAGSKVMGSVQTFDGWVVNVTRKDARIYVAFGSDGRHIFSAIIQPENRRAFHGFDLNGLEAHRVRIHGVVQDFEGRPQIVLVSPSQIDVLN